MNYLFVPTIKIWLKSDFWFIPISGRGGQFCLPFFSKVKTSFSSFLYAFLCIDVCIYMQLYWRVSSIYSLKVDLVEKNNPIHETWLKYQTFKRQAKITPPPASPTEFLTLPLIGLRVGKGDGLEGSIRREGAGGGWWCEQKNSYIPLNYWFGLILKIG